MKSADTHIKLAEALRKLIVLADRHEPEWASEHVLADYRATVMDARIALAIHDPSSPAEHLALLPPLDESLALAA